MIGVTAKLRKNTESNGDGAPQQDATERGRGWLRGLRLTPRGDAEPKADFAPFLMFARAQRRSQAKPEADRRTCDTFDGRGIR